MTVYKTHVAPLHTALTQRFPDLGIVVGCRDYQNVGEVAFEWKEKRYLVQTPPTQDWRANDYKWWLHKFTEQISGKTGQ